MSIDDMSLDELGQYQGTTPRPDDFDQFWDAALEEMHETFPEVELVPDEFQVRFAESFTLYFTGVRGARVKARYVRPKNEAMPHPAVLQFNGNFVSCGHWCDSLGYVALGASVATLDCSGNARTPEDADSGHVGAPPGHVALGLTGAPEDFLMKQVFLDAAQLTRIVMSFPEVDEHRVGVMGTSDGGGVTLACAALEPRVSRAAAFLPCLSDYQHVWELDLLGALYHEAQDALEKRGADPKDRQEFFTGLGYIDVQHLAARIGAEVMMGIGPTNGDGACQDSKGCGSCPSPPSTQFAAFNKIKSPKDSVIYAENRLRNVPDFARKTLEFMADL